MQGLTKKLLSSLGLPAILLTLSTFYLSYRLVHPKRRPQKTTPKDFELPYKTIEFSSKDKTRLKGWLIEKKKSKSLIVLSHGYSYDKQSMLPAAKELYSKNYSILLFDYRAHGESGGHKTTIGFLEQYDLLAAIGFAKKLKYRKVGIIGVSMGAAAALMVGAKTKNINLIVADSSFARLKDVIYGKIPVLTHLILKFMKLHGVNPEDSEPIRSVPQLKIPVMYIHSKKDKLIPYKHSSELFKKTRSEKKLLLFEDGEHGRSYLVKTNGYSDNV